MSQSCLGVIPSFKARVSVAVPYSSVPHMYSVLRLRVPEQSLVVRSKTGRRPLTRISGRVVSGRGNNKCHDDRAHRLYTSALRVLPMILPSNITVRGKHANCLVTYRDAEHCYNMEERM